jgi:DNA polymerase V
MGAPVYQWRDLIEKEGIVLFSANFPLYGDMSHRVMQTLEESVPDVEVYSIDEAFLDLSDLQITDITRFCRDLRGKVKQWTGIPVSIGIGCTKTLAKAANKLAKKNPEYQGVFNLSDQDDPDLALSKLPVEDVWGIGRKYTKFLNKHNIYNTCELKHADQVFIRHWLTVSGERTLLELNGTSCMPLSRQPKPKKVIACTRSFGHYQKEYRELAEAVSYFTRNIGEKLREQHSLAQYLQVFVLTNLHNKNQAQYHNSIVVKLTRPSDYTPDLIKHALQGLKHIFRPGYNYKKAGVLALGLIPEDLIQYDMFTSENTAAKKAAHELMTTIDKINHKIGDDTIKFASEGVARGWWMNQTQRSQRFTTSWQELPDIKA